MKRALCKELVTCLLTLFEFLTYACHEKNTAAFSNFPGPQRMNGKLSGQERFS
jgi:hypothetical protein